MIKESRAIGPDWDFSQITFSVRQLLCIKKYNFIQVQNVFTTVI